MGSDGADISTQPTRVAVVTGAAQGIGRSIALRLAQDGLDVAVNDLESKLGELNKVVEEVEKLGRRAIAIPGDVTSENLVAGMITKAFEELGGVDVMVANAGIAAAEPLVDMSAESMTKVINVNFMRAFYCFKHAAKQMVNQGRGGRLLVASSVCGTMGTRNLTAYCSSKFTVRGMMQTAAIELKEHNITANAYAPGIIRTEMTLVGRPAWEGEDGGRATFMKVTDWPEKTSDAEPEVIASIVSYLSKPEAYFITGQTIGVNGGLRSS